MRTFARLGTALALTAALACGLFATKIADIKENPSRFENRQVTVHGKVSGVTKLPFMTQGFYDVDDGTGTLMVLTEGALPKDGATVSPSGTVHSELQVGGKSFGLVLKEGR